MAQAFREHPSQFDTLRCNLVAAGEASGTIDAILDRLATYQEKTMAIKNKIRSALVYPVAVLVVAFIVLTVIMIFVILFPKGVVGEIQHLRHRSKSAGESGGRHETHASA